MSDQSPGALVIGAHRAFMPLPMGLGHREQWPTPSDSGTGMRRARNPVLHGEFLPRDELDGTRAGEMVSRTRATGPVRRHPLSGIDAYLENTAGAQNTHPVLLDRHA